mmetsp:Transcript_7048/g.6310  ORF Transcript_7048/g.6310 Transcript_7048/m.6310 type:complete len:252 (-) Transcript_7048:603-1358(-)
MQHNQSNFEMGASFITNETSNRGVIKLKNVKLKNILVDDLMKNLGYPSNEVKTALFSNNLIDEVPSKFLIAFKELKRLYLDNNYIYKIPKDLSLMKNLQTLALNNNLLTFLPKEIGQLTSLTSLLLHNNKLTTLPIELSKLRNLKRISLHNNRFIKLPNILHFFKHLEEISIQWFAYLNPPMKRLVKCEGNGIQILNKLQNFCKDNLERHKSYFNFDEFAAYFTDKRATSTQPEKNRKPPKPGQTNINVTR